MPALFSNVNNWN